MHAVNVLCTEHVFDVNRNMFTTIHATLCLKMSIACEPHSKLNCCSDVYHHIMISSYSCGHKLHFQHQQLCNLWCRTIVLVTNQLQFTRHADKVVYMQDGRIEEVGTYAELVAMGGGFAKLITQTEVRMPNLQNARTPRPVQRATSISSIYARTYPSARYGCPQEVCQEIA